ncbi:MAG: Mrp/NBP35 family ATP-binding protein [Clostridia bacterium]|nr:Mrp/NBP35 family ATP-binding protein [Clostridia bacterium]
MNQQETCTHNCDTCGADCPSRSQESLIQKPNDQSRIQKVIGVVSGKGGVGKSMVTSLLALEAARAGKKTAILDADLTGPSIPRVFGLRDRAVGDDTGLYPAETRSGIKVMSINLLLENETDPVVWRGPVIAGTVAQFWTEVNWGDVDYMFVDMPPGTGDVPLTVFQSLPVDGIVVVTSPQELVAMIVEKAVKMADLMKIPVLGLVENMAYVTCPDCGRKIYPFGESHLEESARTFGIGETARMPLDPALAGLCDKGLIESYGGEPLKELFRKIDG